MPVGIFGASLDPDEREDYIYRKRKWVKKGGKGFEEPYDGVIDALSHRNFNAIYLGEIPIESWLLPRPCYEDMPLLTLENFVVFIDADGCLEYAKVIENFVSKLDEDIVPIMIGVDHSLSGGAFKALKTRYPDTSLIVLDSHFDVISSPTRCGINQYDLENNPESVFNPWDPYIWFRSGNYTNESFLKFALDHGWLEPSELLVIGARDNPPLDTNVEDHRVKQFIEEYYSPVRSGSGLILGKKLDSGNMRDVVNRIKESRSDHVYISIDIDIGSGNILSSRFKPNSGFSERNLILLIKTMRKWLEKQGTKVCGMDIMEMDTYEANASIHGRENKTYDLCASMIELLI